MLTFGAYTTQLYYICVLEETSSDGYSFGGLLLNNLIDAVLLEVHDENGLIVIIGQICLSHDGSASSCGGGPEGENDTHQLEHLNQLRQGHLTRNIIRIQLVELFFLYRNRQK